MNSTKRVRCVAIMSCVLVFLILCSPSQGLAQSGVNTERIMGANRFVTAVEISKTGWSAAETVVLARGDHYADALAGVSLAYSLDAPILLTPTNQLHTDTLEEIHRLNARNIIILGGSSAISETVAQALSNENLYVERIGGVNRFETAANIARRIGWGSADTAVVVYSHDFLDALVAAPYAARMGYPVLLTGTNQLAEETSAAIAEMGINSSIVIGNENKVSNTVLAKLPGAVRVGNPRYLNNSVPVADYFGYSSNNAFIATSADFADAMTGAVLAAKQGSGIFMVGESVPPEITGFIQGHVSIYTIFGGSNAVSYQVENNLRNPGSVPPQAEGISLNRYNLELFINETAQLTATVTPVEASGQTVSWTSSNTEVLTVDTDGVVTPIKAGSAIVTASVADGKTADCSVVVKYNSTLSAGTYNVVSSAGLCLNAYSTAATVFPYGLVTASSDGSSEQKVVAQMQADGSYTLKVLRDSGMNIYAQKGIASGKALYVNSSSSTDFVLTKHTSGKYIVACKDNPGLVLTATNEKPYSSYAHYYVKLTTYTGASNQLWTFKPVDDLVATSLTFPIDVKDSAVGDNQGVVDVSATAAKIYGGKVSYYTNGGEDYTCGHYGTNYRAVDINFPNDKGKTVYAIADGIVVNVGYGDGTVFVKHTVPLTLNDGSRTYRTWYSIYAHMSSIPVKENQKISQGTVLGKLSDAGLPPDAGPHLHFAVTTKLYNGYSGFHYGYPHPGTKDPATLKIYSDATISPYWLSGSFRNISYIPFSDDIADASAVKRILVSTENAPPSN